MWPLVFSRIIVGLLIFEVLAAGLFVLNKAYTLAVLCTPLVGLTVLFNFGMDRAYQKNTQYVPIKLLAERFGPLKTTVTRPPSPINDNEISTEQQQLNNTNVKDTTIVPMIRRKRTVLDEDDFEAETRKYTDFKQPPMTLLDGILNTGMKRYAHPAFLGILPSLWLPNKARKKNLRGNNTDQTQTKPLEIDQDGNIQSTAITTDQPIVNSPTENTNRDLLAIKEEEEQEERQQQQSNQSSPSSSKPLSREPIPPSINISSRLHPNNNNVQSDDDEDDSFEDGTTYYHHPERRLSRTLSRSYGSTSKS